MKWAASCAPFGGGSETCASPDELLAHIPPSNVLEAAATIADGTAWRVIERATASVGPRGKID